MTRAPLFPIFVLACLGGTACGRRPAPPPAPPPPAKKQGVESRPAPLARPKRAPHPLDRTVSLAFDGVALPDVISRVASKASVGIAVSPIIPVEEWQRHPVTLRMSNVPLRAFLDWLVRPLRAEYVIEADGAVWLTRGDALLLKERVVVRSIRVPPHFRRRRAVRGTFDYRREQKAIVRTLDACLGYLYQQRRGCRLAFHGEIDVLVAALPPRGQARLDEILDAMRYGTEKPKAPHPSRQELLAKLAAPVRCDWGPASVTKILPAVAERAGVNIGWDAPRLGAPRVALPRATLTLRQILALVAQQTRLGACRLEEGHGIWIYLDGERRVFPHSGAVPWDRAFVRAYDVRRLLRRRSPQAIVAALQKQVDPGAWEAGLPAASVFLPTLRLIVVHDEHGQRRVAAVLDDLLVSRIRGVEEPKKDGQP